MCRRPWHHPGKLSWVSPSGQAGLLLVGCPAPRRPCRRAEHLLWGKVRPGANLSPAPVSLCASGVPQVLTGMFDRTYATWYWKSSAQSLAFGEISKNAHDWWLVYACLSSLLDCALKEEELFYGCSPISATPSRNTCSVTDSVFWIHEPPLSVSTTDGVDRAAFCLGPRTRLEPRAS